MSTRQFVEHFFRHEYGRLVATLCRRVGVQHIEAVEDAVQGALMAALESWHIAGLPDTPSAWLFRAAHNDLMGNLRRQTRRRSLLEQHAGEIREIPEDGDHRVRTGCRDKILASGPGWRPRDRRLGYGMKSNAGLNAAPEPITRPLVRTRSY